jgi:hypothetical protein
MPTELRLCLPGYLPPSPNRLLGVHWSLVRKERVKVARAALLSALSDVPDSYSIPITSTPASSSWSIGSAKRALLRATQKPTSSSKSAKSKSPRPRKSVRQGANCLPLNRCRTLRTGVELKSVQIEPRPRWQPRVPIVRVRRDIPRLATRVGRRLG